MTPQSIRIPAREISVIAQAEVLVVGAGPAGLAAAVGAGRVGADVLLLERYGYVGGQATGGLVLSQPPARRLAAEDPPVTIEPPGMVGVVTNEIQERLVDMGGARWGTEAEDYRPMWYPEELKWLGLRMLDEAGVRPLFHSMAVSALVEDGAIRGVVIETKSGRHAILAQQIVDCSGDADVAARAGVPFVMGDSEGKMLPVSLTFTIRGIDLARFGAWREQHPDLPSGQRMHLHSLRGDELLGMHGHIRGIDATDPWQLTRAENEARSVAMERLQWLKANADGCENAYLALSAPQFGVRDTRLIRGEHVVTEEEMATGMVFRDHIGFVREGKSVPYRSLVPLGVDNLLVGGRCISQDHNAVETTRAIPPCMVTGLAAGVAAALAASEGTVPRRLDVDQLQARLRGMGVLFPPGEWSGQGGHS